MFYTKQQIEFVEKYFTEDSPYHRIRRMILERAGKDCEYLREFDKRNGTFDEIMKSYENKFSSNSNSRTFE